MPIVDCNESAHGKSRRDEATMARPDRQTCPRPTPDGGRRTAAAGPAAGPVLHRGRQAEMAPPKIAADRRWPTRPASRCVIPRGEQDGGRPAAAVAPRHRSPRQALKPGRRLAPRRTSRPEARPRIRPHPRDRASASVAAPARLWCRPPSCLPSSCRHGVTRRPLPTGRRSGTRQRERLRQAATASRPRHPPERTGRRSWPLCTRQCRAPSAAP